MKKRSILGRVGVVAVALTLATTSMMSGTLAKYQTTETVTAEALIAKWKADVTDNTGNTIEGTLNLATSQTTTGTKVDVSKIGSTGAGENNRIAPGTKGTKTIRVDVTGSEVPVLMTMQIKKQTGYVIPEHLKVWIVEGTDSSKNQIGSVVATWNPASEQYELSLDDAKAHDLVGGNAGKAQLFNSVRTGGTQVKNYTLCWEWPLGVEDYETLVAGGDIATQEGTENYNDYDNEYGKEDSGSPQKFGFDIIVNLEQLDNTTASSSYDVVK